MTIDDLTTTARLWIEDHRLPEPHRLTVVPRGRIELTYYRTTGLPDIGWRDSSDGRCEVHESKVGDVDVSVFALKAVAA